MKKTCNGCLFYGNSLRNNNSTPYCEMHFAIENIEKITTDLRGNLYYGKPLEDCVKTKNQIIYSQLLSEYVSLSMINETNELKQMILQRYKKLLDLKSSKNRTV